MRHPDNPAPRLVLQPLARVRWDYATLAHEMAHWTRHETRLNRDFGRKRFGDAGYAMEELVVEIGAV